MKVYLDNCCFNRPFDDQSRYRIRIEAEAKLYVQELIRKGELELAWSYMLDYENQANPFRERREAVEAWRSIASYDIEESDGIIVLAIHYGELGIRPADCLHLACAVKMGCDYFLTTDDALLNKLKKVKEIIILDPPTFVRKFDR
jgi:predicted nucleic acid-binding protein